MSVSIQNTPLDEAATMASAELVSNGSASDFFALLKPRVMSLVIFTSFAAMYLADAVMHPALALISLFAIAAGAGASGAINQWYDRDIDAIMSRTKNRPIPSGRIAPAEALALGIVISVLSVMLLSLSANLLAGGLLAFTIFFYAVIYSVWLKRSTPQNIVIGGAAGAFPPVVGWAAISGTITLDAIMLFALIFFWTPPHFWALALVKNEDYTKASIPMLPVVAGKAETRKQILIYSLILAPLGIAPTLTGLAGPLYGAIAALLGGIFLYQAVRLYRSASDAHALGLFKYSIVYLFMLFALMIADKFLADLNVMVI
jgi:heme o synthase